MSRRAPLALVVLAALAPSRDTRAETRPPYGGSVEATLLGAPVTLDPVAASTHAEETVDELVFDTLYRLGPDGIARPHLARAEPVLDERRTTVRITIRDGVTFQDGTPLTAQDVARSLERARAAVKWPLAAVLAVHVDGSAIELTLRVPVPELTTLLALPQLAVTKGGRPPGEHPVGSGPFAVETWDLAHHRLALRAYDGHFAGRPYVDHLALRWYAAPDAEARRFEVGHAHVSTRGVAAFAGAKPAFRADDVEGPAALLVFVGFGLKHPALRDPAFRRALDLALARGGLTTISTGERVVPTRSPVPIEAGGAPLDAAGRTGDAATAVTLLAGAARRVPALSPQRLGKLEILVEDTRPDDHDVAERVALALDKLGIGAVITSLPAALLRSRVARGQADLWIGQLAEPVTSATAWWGAAFAAGNDDWAIGAMAAAGTIDPAAAARAFADRMPIVPLMFRSVRMWHRTDLRGVTFDASGRPCYADMFLFGTPTPTRRRRR